MIIDYIARTNNMSYNIKLAKLFGIYSSAFINLLLDLHFSKSRDEEYIKLSREDIYNLSGMDEEKQKEVEENLVCYRLIELSPLRNSSSKNYYKLNIDLLTQILSSNDEHLEEELQKTFTTFKKATEPPKTLSKRAAIIKNLKLAIKTKDEVARQALEDWIDAIMQKSGYLAKNAVEYMEEQLQLYSKNKITLFRELCKLVSRLAYKDPKWVIKNYEENNSSNPLQLNNLSQAEVDENIEKLKNYDGETF